ncbi:MAG: L,D-transpeptidase family protein [Planctomycetaceae bacterium]
MEPFAYQRRAPRSHGRSVLAVLACGLLTAWYLDLMPEMVPVETGRLDTESDLSDAEFLALMQPEGGHASQHDSPIGHEPFDEGNRLAPKTVAEPIENSFPEFAAADQSPSELPTDVLPHSLPELSEPEPMSDPNVQPASYTTKPGSTAVSPVLSAETAEQLRLAEAHREAGETLEAHAIYSQLYWKQVELRPAFQEHLNETAAEIYANPRRHFADPYVVQYGETLDQIAKQFEVPWQYLARLNSVTPQTLQAGQTLKVLKGPFGAVVDLDRMQLTLHCHGWYVRHYTVGIGRNQRTPAGHFTVLNKLENPEWSDPDGGTVDADDPQNPLGEYWLGLGDHIGIHGTIDPDSIGKAASRGCIHMADGDIEEVFQLLGVGSPVLIRK